MKIIASIFGIGYIKGGGTIAALVAALLWYGIQPSISLQWILILLTMILGIWTGNRVEADWGKDSSKVVIDEVLGMFISVLFVPATAVNIIAGLIFFRFFDIAKPLGVRRMEHFRGGWGVMLDDALAGVYANLLLQVIVHFKIPERFL